MPTLLFILAALLTPVAAHAQAPTYDSPVSTRTVKAGDTELRCTYYGDLMVRESGTDSPVPDPVVLVPGHGQPCSAARMPRQAALREPGYSLTGRRGPFLVLSATDPNGAVPFMVVTSVGKVLYTDATAMDRGIRALIVGKDTLHLVFTRGVNADCSLAQGAVACWSRLIASSKVPRVMAGLGPTAKDCSLTYEQAKAPANNPSMVAYDVDMTVELTGRVLVTSRGSVSCAPLP